MLFPLSLLFILSLFLVFQFFWQSLFTFTLLDFLIDFFAWLVEGFLQIFSVLASSSLWTLFKKTPFDFLTGMALGLIAIFFSYKILKFLMIIFTRRSTLSLDLKSLLLSFLGLILLLNILVQPSKSWQVYFLDVGQGDSCLIISPDRKSVLIDGGLPGKGHQIVLPAMEHLGLATIDQAIISHFDQDHCGGIIDLLEIDKVEEVIVPQMLNSDLFLSASREIEAGVEDLCCNRDIPLIRLQKNDLLNLDSIDLQTKILAPDLENCYQIQDDNAYSLCFALEIENFAILFTGDLTKETEEDLIIKQVIPDVDLLKVAHHGSKFSTFENFIEQAQPNYAVISVGNNSYGHPSLEVLQRLDQYNVMVRRTDINGAIMLELKNRQWILTSYLE